jgi:hypothetical protein
VLIEVGILSILPQDAHVTLSYLSKMAKVQIVYLRHGNTAPANQTLLCWLLNPSTGFLVLKSRNQVSLGGISVC